MEDNNHSIGRRNFMATTVQSIGLAVLGGMLWSGYPDSVKALLLVLRPPSALKESDFLTACIKCGLRAEACLNRDTNVDKEKVVIESIIQTNPLGRWYIELSDTLKEESMEICLDIIEYT